MVSASTKQFLKDNSGYTAPKIVADPTKITPIKTLASGTVKIQGKLGVLTYKRSKNKQYLRIYETSVSDSSGSIRAIWFNSPRLDYTDKTRDYIFLGVVEDTGGIKTLIDPIFTTVDEVKKWQAIYEASKV